MVPSLYKAVRRDLMRTCIVMCLLLSPSSFCEYFKNYLRHSFYKYVPQLLFFNRFEKFSSLFYSLDSQCGAHAPPLGHGNILVGHSNILQDTSRFMLNVIPFLKNVYNTNKIHLKISN